MATRRAGKFLAKQRCSDRGSVVRRDHRAASRLGAAAMPDSIDPLVQIRLSDLLTLQAAVGVQRQSAPATSLPGSTTRTPLVASSIAEYLSTREAAAVLGVSTKCLEAWRSRGEGPPFSHVGRAVRYPNAALHAWVTSNPTAPADRPGLKAASPRVAAGQVRRVGA